MFRNGIVFIPNFGVESIEKIVLFWKIITLNITVKSMFFFLKRKRDLSPVKEQTVVNVDKAVFVGSTRDLIKQIKQVG